MRLGADAVGYTLYVGSPRQDEDFKQFALVRDEAEKLGMPVIVWAYPRGEAIKAKGRAGRHLCHRLRGPRRHGTGRGRGQGELPAAGHARTAARRCPNPTTT